MFRRLRPHQLAIDIGLAVACFLLALLVYANGFTGSILALTGMATALALRRFSPPLALGLAWATALIQVSFGIGPDPSNLAILPVLYASAAYGDPLVKWAGLASTGIGAFVIAGFTSLQTLLLFQPSAGNSVFLSTIPQAVSQFFIMFFAALAVFVLSWTLGLLAKTWRNARESGQARVIAERQRIDAQQSVVIEQERGRIARDMHDVVAHSLAVVIAQADGARYAQDNDPDAVGMALATISSTARAALGDVRILLGQLRHSEDEGPQPVLADLDRLLDKLRASGLSIEFDQAGTPVPLGTGQQLAVYRIVQEALTNALRHGDTTQPVAVAFDWEPPDLAVEITSALLPGQADQGSHAGHGLAGMKERATLAGGWLTAEPVTSRFLVTASIPVAPVEVMA